MLKGCDVGDKLDKFSAYHLVYIPTCFPPSLSLFSLAFVCENLSCSVLLQRRLWLKGRSCAKSCKEDIPLLTKSGVLEGML
jgi:hypothetical protein